MTEPRYVVQRMSSALGGVMQRLEGSQFDKAFKDRMLELATAFAFDDPPEREPALETYRWALERLEGDGLRLTAAGYLQPAEVREWAAALPTMRAWIHSMTREVDVFPVLDFREHLLAVRFARRYKGTLRLTRLGRTALGDPDRLWEHLAYALIASESPFEIDALAVILVHMGTTDGRIDTDTIAETIAELGWVKRDGSRLNSIEVHYLWNDLWTVLGNVGAPTGDKADERRLSMAARCLIRDALFEEVGGELPDEPSQQR